MNRKNRAALAVARAAGAVLVAKSYASKIDVLVEIGRLDAGTVERWRRGQIDYLERVVQSNLKRISGAMKLFRAWVAEKGLYASTTAYVARTPRRQTLRFSQSGKPGDRSTVPDPLGLTRTLPEEARAPGRESQPRAGIGGDPADERRVGHATGATAPAIY
jgi:hypothetical protein